MLVRQQELPRHVAGAEKAVTNVVLPGWPPAQVAATLDSLRAVWGSRPGTFSLELVPSIDSTNTELMRRARAGCADSVLLVAGTQSAGRGRLGRGWHDSGAQGSLQFSISLPLAPRYGWLGLSLAAGVALADSLDPGAKHGVALKWPNDLWLGQRKLAGILIETSGAAQAMARQLVLGIGINLACPTDTDLATPPAWLREFAPEAEACSVLGDIAAPLLATLLRFEEHGFAPFHARFDARDLLCGQPVTATGVNSEPLSGTGRGVRGDGALLIETAQGVQTVTAADVSVRPTAAVVPLGQTC